MRSKIKAAVRAIAAAVAVCTIGTGSALAGSMVFDVSATFQGGYDLSGTITINTSTGVVSSPDLSMTSIGSFTSISSQGPNNKVGDLYEVFLGTASLGTALYFDTESLVGYSGGQLTSNSAFLDSPTIYDITGTGMVTLASVPEPSSWVLAATAAVGGLIAMRRRKRRMARAS
jgi:hypothetical protein